MERDEDDPYAMDRALMYRVGNLQGRDPKEYPELLVLCMIFEKFNQIKRLLDFMLLS